MRVGTCPRDEEEFWQPPPSRQKQKRRDDGAPGEAFSIPGLRNGAETCAPSRNPRMGTRYLSSADDFEFLPGAVADRAAIVFSSDSEVIAADGANVEVAGRADPGIYLRRLEPGRWLSL